MEGGKSTSKASQNFFLNDSASEMSSSNSEDDCSTATHLLQHAKAKKALEEKLRIVTAQAEAANIIQRSDDTSQNDAAQPASLGNQET